MYSVPSIWPEKWILDMMQIIWSFALLRKQYIWYEKLTSFGFCFACFLHKQLYQTFIHYRRFMFLNGNVRPLKPDKALVTNGRPFKSYSNSTFIMHGQDWSTFLVRTWLLKNFTFETNPKHTNQIIWQTHHTRVEYQALPLNLAVRQALPWLNTNYLRDMISEKRRRAPCCVGAS